MKALFSSFPIFAATIVFLAHIDTCPKKYTGRPSENGVFVGQKQVGVSNFRQFNLIGVELPGHVRITRF